MSDENRILYSMELFPTVLEQIIIEYITRKEITFRPLNDNKGIIIDGNQLSCTKEKLICLYAAVSPTPFSQCRLRWKVELLSGHKSRFYIGIAFPSYKIGSQLNFDLESCSCRFISFSTTDENDKMCIQTPRAKYYCRSKSIVMEVDLIKCSLSFCAEESDMYDAYNKNIAGTIPIFNIQNLEQCFPFVTLNAENDCSVAVTSYN